MDKHEWYQPRADVDETADVFEEAGFYDLRSRQELYEQHVEQKTKKKNPMMAFFALVCIALLVGAIILTAKLFGHEEQGLSDEELEDVYDQFFDRYVNQETTGENELPRAEPAPELQLELHSSKGLEKLSLQELYEQCLPSVVGISAQQDGHPYSWGTGVVMTSDGYILTNTHVLDGADEAEVVLYNGERYPAKLVGADAISDIAVLKTEAVGLVPAQFGDSSEVRVGDDAIAIGNPLGEEFSGTMTTGIISGVSRDVNYMRRTMTLLQTNAAINSGNSGGPLFNAYGQVIGITNMKMMITSSGVVEGVGFAIPTATVKLMADNILANGAVVGRPGLGVTVIDLQGGTEDLPDGMLVQGITSGSDAEKQGLLVGDVIIAVDGVPVDGIETMRDAISARQVGDTMEVTVWREGEELNLTIALIDQNEMD